MISRLHVYQTCNFLREVRPSNIPVSSILMSLQPRLSSLRCAIPCGVLNTPCGISVIELCDRSLKNTIIKRIILPGGRWEGYIILILIIIKLSEYVYRQQWLQGYKLRAKYIQPRLACLLQTIWLSILHRVVFDSIGQWCQRAFKTIGLRVLHPKSLPNS